MLIFHREETRGEWIGDTRYRQLKSYTCVKFTVSIPPAMSFHSAPMSEHKKQNQQGLRILLTPKDPMFCPKLRSRGEDDNDMVGPWLKMGGDIAINEDLVELGLVSIKCPL